MSNTKYLLASLAILLILILPGVSLADLTGAVADPMYIGVGARPLGMGKAYVAVAEDADTVFMNPAGLGKTDSFKLTSMYSNLMGDVKYMVIGGAQPLGMGTLGAGYVSAGVDSIGLTDADQEPVTFASLNSNVIFLSYGVNLGKILDLGDITKNLCVGVSLKSFNQSTSGVADGIAGQGLDVDLGILYTPTDNISLGFTGQNVLPASMGGKMSYGGGVEESIPALAKLGGKVSLLDKKLTIAADYDLSPMLKNRGGTFHVGAEYTPIDMLTIRAGLDQDPIPGGTVSNITAGVGLRFAGIEFNYAYHAYDSIQENTTHYFSLSFVGEDRERKPLVDKWASYEEEEKEEEEPVVKEVKLARVKRFKPLDLVSFKDVKDGYWAKEVIEKAATAGLIEGYPDGTFRPERVLTRAELATLLVRTGKESSPRLGKSPFRDLPNSHWAAKYVATAQAMGLVKGYPDGTFKPNKGINRAEGTTVMVRFNGEVNTILENKSFTDISSKYWAAKYISLAKNLGLLIFVKGSQFQPSKGLTRAEAISMLVSTDFGKEKIAALEKSRKVEELVMDEDDTLVRLEKKWNRILNNK